jgi:hypothetical protein
MLSFLSPTIYVGKAGPGGAQLTCWVHLLVICVLALCLVFTFIKSIPGVYALVIGVCVCMSTSAPLCAFLLIFVVSGRNPYEPWVVRAYPGGGGLLLF